MEVNLVGKTELWIQNIKLKNADLTEIGKTAAEVLGLKDDEVLVVDASSDHITLDILRNTLSMKQFIGKEEELLKKLSEIEGVAGTEKTSIHSEGILEMITLGNELAEEITSKATLISRQIESAFLKRVKVFPTGGEVISRIIKDTNSPLIKQEFEKRGYEVSIGDPLPDDEIAIANSIENEIYRGYGVIITTGGVGAEEKDRTIEATQRLDPTAAARWTVQYEKKGRHVKEGVRIGVGKVGKTLIINLPGPTDEVKKCLKIILNVMEKRDCDKETLASLLASKLKIRLIKNGDYNCRSLKS
jgi:molybdenum cofactor synthesis domain-containing protein